MSRTALLLAALAAVGLGLPAAAVGRDGGGAALAPGAVEHVVVIDLENESFADTFGAASPARYLNDTLLAQGQLLTNYYATSHVSLGNYVAQVSGQAPTPTVNNDCISLAELPLLTGGFFDVTPGTDAPDGTRFPGQVVGDGCVFPAPTAGSHGARTIGDQLDARGERDAEGPTWRGYAEDMGADPGRDGGTADPLGGTDCAHPTLNGVDISNSAAPDDQYATRHNPFVYFHSVIDDPARCARHVVPLGTLTVGAGGAPDAFAGHLARDLRREDTTPRFAFITPNLCNDGHDHACAGANAEGGHDGGLVAADLWLKHWMPLILGSPAYRSGRTLVVVTFDEAAPTGRSADSTACCGEQGGPNESNPGFSSLLALFGAQTTPAPGTTPYPGGGRIGAVLLNRRWITPGSVNPTPYNHYAALRSYEDLLGITRGGDDGRGHLGFAAARGLAPFGTDVFARAGDERR
ncbi:MAG TPA: alkaline phosphatase family protein [Solirubrobacteraceae bacterium]|jgi:hypothetical protein